MEYVPDRSIWENQIRMKDIITLLPDFEIIGFFDVNLLLDG